MTTETDPARWIDVLAGSHDRICDVVGELDADGLRRPSYCEEWTIAQVLSHLGSGAEIFQVMLDAAVASEPSPGRDAMPPIWERWNALRPEEQAEEFLSTDGQLVETLENLGDRLDDLAFTFFGMMQLDAVGVVGMRLSEHAVHAWDVAVAVDPAATVDADAVSLLIDRLPQMAERTGHAGQAPERLPPTILVDTADPVRHFTLSVDDAVHLTQVDAVDTSSGEEPDGAAVPARLHLPAEAFLRLVYGRLDRGPAPGLEAGQQELVDAVRAVFPGF